MAAGLGFKTFTTGEVLTASDVNGYLMQGVLVFASAAARNSAITSPQEGQFAYTKDTNSLWYYDGAAWVASGATGDIEGVTAGIGISGGGTSGTVTVTNSMATAIDAKGDLVPGTGADTFARLAVGANGTVLTADSAEATGLKWAAAGGTLTIAQIATGSLSGSSVTISSLSSYDDLFLAVWGVDGVSAPLRLRPNGSTSAIYQYQGNAGTASEVKRIQQTANDQFDTYYSLRSTGAENAFTYHLTNCKSAGFTNVAFTAGYDNSSAVGAFDNFQGIFKSAATISSLVISVAGTFTGGTYTLWGA
jgi:hypothetical protein